MAKIYYDGPEGIFTMRSNSMPSRKDYVFHKGVPTEVKDKNDIEKLLKGNFSRKAPVTETKKKEEVSR